MDGNPIACTFQRYIFATKTSAKYFAQNCEAESLVCPAFKRSEDELKGGNFLECGQTENSVICLQNLGEPAQWLMMKLCANRISIFTSSYLTYHTFIYKGYVTKWGHISIWLHPIYNLSWCGLMGKNICALCLKDT